MSERALAGRWDPRGGGASTEELARAIRAWGAAAATVQRGSLALAWSPDSGRAATAAPLLCVLDGRLANGPALAAELGVPPGPDEAIVAAGWSRWGEDLPAHLSGELVLVVWDGDAERGVVARGGLGQRPLFVARSGAGVLFASEARDLLALSPRRPGPDRLAVAHWLAGTGLRDGRTLHEGIERLPPGSMLVLEGREAATRRFWAPRYAPPACARYEETVAVLRDGMRAAVGRALANAGTAGVLLSGGFDSGSVAALATEVSEHAPQAYSAVFPQHPELDESARIAAVRAHLGLPGMQTEIRSGSPLRAALDFQAEWQTPCVSPNWFAWRPLVRRAARDGVATLLDGEGGDEAFGCAPFLIADLLRHGRVGQATRMARALPGMGPDPAARVVWRALARFGARGALPERLHRHLRRGRGRADRAPSWMAPELAALHRADDDPWAWKHLDGPRWWAAKADELTEAAEALGAADQLRREAVSAGLRFTHPYRDRELVDLVLSLPPEANFDPELDRPLAREAMRGVLPAAVETNTEKPHFNAFLAAALEADLPLIRSLIAEPEAPIRAFADPKALRSTLIDLPPGRRPVEWPLVVWRVATLECWLRAEADILTAESHPPIQPAEAAVPA